MQYRILGPLEVLDDGEPIAVGTLKERVVLAVLLLHANEFVSRERLIDELWGEAAPPTATKAVNVYLSHLRKTLTRENADPIVTADGGYRLVVEPGQLDAAQMQRLLASARERAAAGEHQAAAFQFQEALTMWRGPTLAGLQLESQGRHEIAQLEESRLTARMDRIDCDLALGRHEQALGELSLLVREHPLRERLHAQQMLALYRADRQADALAAYAEARRTLVEDLGIEPSPALQRLQQGILRHDSALETPTGKGDVGGSAPLTPVPPSSHALGAGQPGTRRRLTPRPWQLALGGLVILAASAVIAALLSTSSHAAPQVVPNTLVRLDPRTGKVVTVIPVGVEPGQIAITPSAIWTDNHGDRTVSRYDLRTHTVQSRGGFPIQPYDMVADAEGNVWVSSKASIVTRLAFGPGGTSAGPLTPSHTATIHIPPPGAASLALGAGYVWVIVGPLTLPGQDDRLSLVDLATDRVVNSLRLGRETTSIAFGDGAVWVGAFVSERKESSQPNPPWTGPSWLYVLRAGARRAQSYRVENGDACGPVVTVGEQRVWVLTCGRSNLGGRGQTLVEIDPDTRQVIKRIPLHNQSANQFAFLAAGGGSVWLTNQAANSVLQLDPSTGHIVRTIPLGRRNYASTCGIAATHDAVWVSIGDAYCDTVGR